MDGEMQSATYVVNYFMLCRGETEACRTLLDLGVDINGNVNGNTPAMAAVIGAPSFEALKLIVSNPNLKLDAKVHCAGCSCTFIFYSVFASY